MKVDWKSMELSYLFEVNDALYFCLYMCYKLLLWYLKFVLHFQDKYATHFANNIKKAKPVSGSDIIQKAQSIDGDVRIKYKDQWDFENIAQKFGIFQEWKVFQLFLFSTS